MKSYKIVWFGATGFSKGPLLQVIEDFHQVIAVCCTLDPSPTTEAAREYGIPVLVIKDLKDPGLALTLLGYQADFFVVCDFPLILPEEIINIPRFGCIGIHLSRLPEFRGVAPIEAFLQSGNISSGVTTFLVSKEVDSGDILQQDSWQFDRIIEAFPTVYEALKGGACELISKTLQDFESLIPIPQSNFKYTPSKAPKITKNSRRVRFKNCSPTDILGKMRAFTNNGGIWTTIEGTITEVTIHEGYFDLFDTDCLKGCYTGGLYYDTVRQDFFIPLSSQDEPIVLIPSKIQTESQEIMMTKDWGNIIGMKKIRFD